MAHHFTSVADMPRRYRADLALERAYRRAENVDGFRHVGNLPLGRDTTLDRAEAVDLLLSAGLLEEDTDHTVLHRAATANGYRIDKAVRLPRRRVAQMLADEILLETWLTRYKWRHELLLRFPGWRQILIAHLRETDPSTWSQPQRDHHGAPTPDLVGRVATVLALSVHPDQLPRGSEAFATVRESATLLLESARASGHDLADVITVLSRIDTFAGTARELVGVAGDILAAPGAPHTSRSSRAQRLPTRQAA